MPFVTEMILRSLANPLFSQYQWLVSTFTCIYCLSLINCNGPSIVSQLNTLHFTDSLPNSMSFFCTSVYCVKAPPYGFPAFTGCGYRHQSELPQQRSGHKRSLRCPCGRSSRERHQTAASWFDRRRGWGTANRAHQGMSWLVTLSWTCPHMCHLGLLCLLSPPVNIQREMMWYRHGMI